MLQLRQKALAFFCVVGALAVLLAGFLGYGGFAADKRREDGGSEMLRSTLLVLDKQVWEAMSSHDIDTLRKLFADDYTGLTPDGTRWTKAAILEQAARVRTGDLKLLTEREVFRVHPQAAILTYDASYIIYDKAKVRYNSPHQRMTSCWAQRDGGWFVVFSQITDLGKSATPAVPLFPPRKRPDRPEIEIHFLAP
jgi:ketosteroid isomerase-like protein